jgi:hypothetical protein
MKGFFMQSAHPHDNTATKGNVLFFILIAVALLAALTYSVTKSDRSSGGISSETITFAVNDIMHYANDMHGAVQNLLTSGTDISKLSFENSNLAGYTNASAAAANKVFDPGGGAFQYIPPSTDWLDTSKSASTNYGEWVFVKDACVPYVGSGADGAGGTTACNADGLDNEELVMLLPYVKAEICTAIDQKVGITLCSSLPCSITAPASVNKFTGTFADGFMIFNAGGQYNRQYEGCFVGSGATAGIYSYYKVLVER